MGAHLRPEADQHLEFEEDSRSSQSISSGTRSYGSLKVATQGRRAVAQLEEKKYYRERTVEENKKMGEEEKPRRPFQLDVVGLEQVAARQKKKDRQLLLKKNYRSQEYKRAAFRLMDEYFEQPGRQVLRLSGNTKKGQLVVQMIGVKAAKNEAGLLDDGRLEQLMSRQKRGIDEAAVRRVCSRRTASSPQKNRESHAK